MTTRQRTIILMPVLSERERVWVHHLHISLGCTKKCRRCGRVMPIGEFGGYGATDCGCKSATRGAS